MSTWKVTTWHKPGKKEKRDFLKYCLYTMPRNIKIYQRFCTYYIFQDKKTRLAIQIDLQSSENRNPEDFKDMANYILWRLKEAREKEELEQYSLMKTGLHFLR